MATMVTKSGLEAGPWAEGREDVGHFGTPQQRKAGGWRQMIPCENHPAEAGRYRLYIARACGWSNRCMALRGLKGLQDAVDVCVCHSTFLPTRPGQDEHRGWVFRAAADEPVITPEGNGPYSCDGCTADPEGARDLRELYERSGDTDGRYLVPMLWDKVSGRVVNNEDDDIMAMFNSSFDVFAKNPEVDMYPEARRADIDSVMTWLYPGLSNGVYIAGFSDPDSQAPKVAKVFESLDKMEAILAQQPFLVGEDLSTADINAYCVLVRFDEVYYTHFKCSTRQVRDYPSIWAYLKRLFVLPGFGDETNMSHIKMHYYSSHLNINPGGKVQADQGVMAELLEGLEPSAL